MRTTGAIESGTPWGDSYPLPTVTRDMGQGQRQLKMGRWHRVEEGIEKHKKKKTEAKGKARKCSWFTTSIGAMGVDTEERNTWEKQMKN